MASFISRGLQLNWGTDSGNTSIFGARNGDDFLTNSDSPPGCDWHPVPTSITLERLAIRDSAAAGENFTFKPRTQIPSVDTGPNLVLATGFQEAEGNVAVTQPSPSIIADLSTDAFLWRGDSPGAFSTNARLVWKYSFGAPNDKYSLLATGFSFANFFSAFATGYMPVGIGPQFSPTESDIQMPAPFAATFKYFLVVLEGQDTSGDSTYNFAFRVNGVDQITSSFTNTTSPQLVKETATSAPVVAGDLISFAASTTGPVDIGHRARIYFAIGVLPS